MKNQSVSSISTRNTTTHACQIFIGKPEGKRLLGRTRRRWEYNLKVYLRVIRYGDVDWIHLAQDRNQWRALVNKVINHCVP
jgi:hypothetical protein